MSDQPRPEVTRAETSRAEATRAEATRAEATRAEAGQAADAPEDAPSALHAVQVALDRRDNGGAADRPAPGAAAADGGGR